MLSLVITIPHYASFGVRRLLLINLRFGMLLQIALCGYSSVVYRAMPPLAVVPLG